MLREQKAEIINDAVSRLGRCSGLYLLNFSGMTVEQANNLRREFFKISVEYRVIKNTLFQRALEEVGGYEDVYPYLVNQTGVVFTYEDPVLPARILEKFIKDNKELPKVKAVVIEKSVFDGSRLAEIAALPTHKDLLAGIVGAIAAPAQGLAGTIHAVIQGLVGTIDAIEKQKAQAA
jgi:large subunit ribosomal protein L10